MQLELIPQVQDPSLTAPIPAGWQRILYQNITGETYAKVADTAVCFWYWLDSAWTLYVPWFRSTRPKSRQDDIAVVYHLNGEVECPISPRGTITLPDGRKITRRHWNH